MKFTDFTPQELIGKKVLHTWGSAWKEIKTISRVTPKFFIVDKVHNTLFSLQDGTARGNSRSHCRLITEEEAKEVTNQNKIIDGLRDCARGLKDQRWYSIKETQSNLDKMKDIVKLVKSLEV